MDLSYILNAKGYLPKFDIPEDFLAGEDIFGDVLKFYSLFPCKIRSAVFVLVRAGELRATINLNEYTVVAGDLVTLMPESFIQILDIKGEVRLQFAGFSSGFLDKLNDIQLTFEFVPELLDHPVIRLTEEQIGYFDDFFNWMIKMSVDFKPAQNASIHKSVLNLLVNQVTELHRTRPHWNRSEFTREKEIYSDYIRHLLEHYKEQHSVSFYARKLGLTLQHFSYTIKKASGKTASEIIHTLLIMEAKAQLKSSQLSIKQIALSLGFSTPNFFYKYFKQHTGMTPQEYRDSD